MSGMTNDVQNALEEQLSQEELDSINFALEYYQGGGEQDTSEPEREPDATFYAQDYPPLPEGPGALTGVKSSLRSIGQEIGLLDEEKSDAQLEMEAYQKELGSSMEDRQATYEAVGKEAKVDIPLVGEVSLGTRVQEGKVANPDFDPTQPESEENSPYKYRSMYVPAPDTTAPGRVVGELATRVVEGLGDFIIDRKFLEEGVISEALPNMPQGSGESLVTEITSYLIPGLGARKAAQATVKGVDEVVNIAKSIDPKYVEQARRAAQEALDNGESITSAGSKAKGIITAALAGTYASLGETMIAPPETEGWIIDGDLIEELTPLKGADAEATALFLESSGFGTALSVLAKALGAGKDFVKNKAGGLARFNKGMTKDMFESINSLKILQTLDPNLMEGTPEVVAMRMRILAEEVATNKVAKILDDAGPEVRLDSTNALIQSTRNYVRRAYAYLGDGMDDEAFEALIDEKSIEMANNMLMLRGGMAANKGVITAEAKMLNDVGVGLQQQVTDQVEMAGFDSVNQGAVEAAENLVTKRATDIASEQTKINAIDKELAALEELQATGLATDKDLGPLLAQFEGVGDIGFTKQYTDRLKTIMGEDAYTAWKSDFDQVNKMYDEFPAGEAIDAKGLSLAVKDATEALNMLDTSGRVTKTLLGSMAVAFNLPKAVAKDIEGGKAEAFFDRLAEKVDGPNGVDIKYLYTTVKPEIEALIKEAQKKGDVRVAQRLIALKSSITQDQLDYLIENGSPEVAEYARNADRTFKSYTNRWQPDSTMPMGRFDEAARVRATAERRSATENDPDVLAQGQERFATEASRAVESMSSDLAGAGFDPLIRAVKGSIDEDIAPRFAEYYGTLTLKAISDAIASGNQQNLQTLNSAATAYLPKLEALNSPLVPKLRQAQTNLQMLQSGVADATEVAQVARAEAVAAKETAEKSIVARLVSEGDDITVAVSDADNVIADIFNGNNAVNKLNQLLAKADELSPFEAEAARAAIKAVALRTATEKVFTYSRGAVASIERQLGGLDIDKLQTSNKASIKNAVDILDNERNKTLDALSTVFADDPVTVDVYKGLLQVLDAVTIPSTVRYDVTSNTAALNQMATASESTSTAIVLTVGVLNPTATMARNLSRGLTASLDEAAKQIDQDVMADLMENPQSIVDAARKLADGVDPELVQKELANRLGRATGAMTSATGLAESREPDRTEKQDIVEDEQGYQQYLDEQMREIIGIQ